MRKTDTEKDQLQGQLVRAHRLSELGQMAAGFAHEINNPLQIIKSEHSLIEMILADLKKAGVLEETESLKELDDSMSQIKTQVDRCAKITHSILKFGRQGEAVAKPVDLRSFIPEVTEIIDKKASVHGIGVTLDIFENTPEILGDIALDSGSKPKTRCVFGFARNDDLRFCAKKSRHLAVTDYNTQVTS